MIEKKVTYDNMISEDGKVNVRTITRIMEDGVELSKTYHRKVIDPMEDDWDKEDSRTRSICRVLQDIKNDT